MEQGAASTVATAMEQGVASTVATAMEQGAESTVATATAAQVNCTTLVRSVLSEWGVASDGC
jgi:hypothetical protein